MTAEAGAPGGRTACTADELLAEARASLPRRPSPAEALAAPATGAQLIDIRGDDQRRTCGLIPGALLLPRNALEWRCEPARAEFGSLSEVAREALVEMRRLLGVLRQDQPAALAPQPQLADLPALVDTVRRAGVSVELSVPLALGQVPSGVGVCAYRIVQESLSNASQHAPGAPVTVSVNRDSGAVLLQVANGPGESADPPVNDHGLVMG
jgi:signal transduction histidine kinase